MFKAIIESEKLKETIESVSSIVDEAKLNLTPDGLTIRAVDPANVAMVSLTIKSSAFEEFTATDGEPAQRYYEYGRKGRNCRT